MSIAEEIKGQINKLALIQFMLWGKKLPEGFNWQAIQISFCYHLLKIPFKQKLTTLSLGLLDVMVRQLISEYVLPSDVEELERMERDFRLKIKGKRYAVSDCSAVNDLLLKEESNLRLCSGFYGGQKFYLLGEAKVKKISGFRVHYLKAETAATPGCHLLMAAMLAGDKNIFLRENSARFLFYQKWRNPSPGLEGKIRKHTLKQFGGEKKLISAFIDNLLWHELNHGSYFSALAQAASILGPNILGDLQEVFADWLPGKGIDSPIAKICAKKRIGQLSLYIADSWFYDSSFPEMKSFSFLTLAPIFRHMKKGKIDFAGVMGEISHLGNGSLLTLYRRHFEAAEKGLLEIVKNSKFTVVDRPLNFSTIALYAEDEIKRKNKNAAGEEYEVTFWSNIFNYLKKYSPEGWRNAREFLIESRKKLEHDVRIRIMRGNESVDEIMYSRAGELVGGTNK
ncbi:hypothetical protein A2276_04145 [candidate division WOR-1 bacterium RIFOXYA12_FULL_43_27]|uniref:Uncharacterized protein n=1 Tax=candidate division WOR-1 bacterium RIFOXYC2_FULL_46_14 TaxID=1802587 RepID=A0A1F4U758_UNCSA|nr:MAG: hypothetical protein A2276_04145 [candidate division WOR-1 bacterium RIFOXYA12_FULL_43_27]OGC19119.1 MAG: hypothetical protein A2292_00190 [candidate division WOR-1 bacterium RIFOXYB2_FULL_46_45]OGC30107.1 MAG: hypothetical protein A2232_00190 [candidate division WOR-1 bacterium RIFOXYA2_FULL_46_56]OGC40709.1 MAG: hypothetical protein A2438_00195 [candidate division WOR-1 bacterium RIFOXYC2_FULL_46_14]